MGNARSPVVQRYHATRRRTYALDRLTWRFAPNLRALSSGSPAVGPEARFVGVNYVPRIGQLSRGVDYSELEVTAAAASPERSSGLTELGAAQVVHDGDEPVGMFEVVLEGVGGPSLERCPQSTVSGPCGEGF